MNTPRTASGGATPQPEDPEFFSRYSAPDGLLDWAFGPQGGNPPPRISEPAPDRAGPVGRGPRAVNRPRG